MNKPILSLCLPTNGIIEWVFPVLDSIYAQAVNQVLFEVVVTNNGNNDEFHKLMIEYTKKHSNLIYKKTDAYMFYNQLEALKLASGEYLKFVNHRAVMTEGSINRLIKTVNDNISKKPVMYFSNGVLKGDCEAKTFNDFVAYLGRWASWTTGVGIWKSDYDNLLNDLKIDKISPHSCILFANRDRDDYKIYNFVFSKEIDKSHAKKGNYDLFKAFGVEELMITQNLYIDGDITVATLKKIKKEYRKIVAELCWEFRIRKKPCSYDLTGFDDAMGIYFNKYDIVLRAYMVGFKRLIQKLLRKN